MFITERPKHKWIKHKHFSGIKPQNKLKEREERGGKREKMNKIKCA